MKQIALLCILLLSSCVTKPNPHITDLDFIYYQILENHPGVYNEEDPNFLCNLKRFYTATKAKIIKAKENYDSQEAITEFAKSFGDPHLWVNWTNSTPKKQNADITSKFSVSLLSKDIVWIILSAFDLNSSQEKDFVRLVKNISELRAKKYIIFDLRGNQGGNSDYGSTIIDTLFEKEYAHQKRCLHNKNVYVDWRSSKGNLSHISSLSAKYPNNHWLKSVENGLKDSLKQGKKFYREYPSEVCEPEKGIIPTSMVNVTIIVVTDSVNVSAALDFIDELKMIATNLVLIGQTTKADRLYMEVRSMPLPSGSGDFFFPIKVYRNRLRLDKEPYIPDIEFTDIYNTPSLQSFILEQIKEKKL